MPGTKTATDLVDEPVVAATQETDASPTKTAKKTPAGAKSPAKPKTTTTDSNKPTTQDKAETKPIEEKSSENQNREPRAPVSQAIVKAKINLRSRHAQRVYRRSYSTAARAFYTLSVMLRIYVNEQEAEQIGAVCDGMLGAVREDLTQEIARMEQVAETQGIDLGAIAYTQPEEFEVEITTPKASQYLGLIREMDRLIGLIDVLWLSGVYNDTQYNAGSYQWQRRLIKLANRLRNLAQRGMALARREDGAAGALAELLQGADENEAGDDNDEPDEAEA